MVRRGRAQRTADLRARIKPAGKKGGKCNARQGRAGQGARGQNESVLGWEVVLVQDSTGFGVVLRVET